MAKGIVWTEEDLQYLTDNVERMGYQQIADALKRSEPSVRSKACRLGLVGRKFGILHHRKTVKASGRKRSV